MIICGRAGDAVGIVERCFGKPGLRKHDQWVFDYLTVKNGIGATPTGETPGRRGQRDR